MNQHFQDMNRQHRKEHKTNWLRVCKRDGLPVTIKSLRSGLSLDAAQQIERQIIKRLRPQLVNVHEGGSSGYVGLPSDAKERHSESGKRRYRNMRQDKRERMIARLACLRQRKAEIRQERIAAGLLEREPRFERHYPFEFGVRVKATGETHFVDLKSVRHAAKALGLILKYIGTKTILALLLSASCCHAIDWAALHEVEGSPAANEVGCSGDLGWTQISEPVWKAYAKPGERWYVKSDNLAVAKRIMDDRFHKLASHRSDFDDAVLWFSPGRRNNPSAVAIDYANRYRNICESRLHSISR